MAQTRKWSRAPTVLLVAGALGLVTIWLQSHALSYTQPAASRALPPRRAQAGGALTDVSNKDPPPRRAQAGGALTDVSNKDPPPRGAQAGGALTDVSNKDPPPRRAQAGGALTDVSGKDPPPLRAQAGGALTDVSSKDPPPRRAQARGALTDVSGKGPSPRRAQAGGALTDVSGKDPSPRKAQAGGALTDVSNKDPHPRRAQAGGALSSHAAAPASAVKVILMDSFPSYYHVLVPGTEVFSSCKHSCSLTLDSTMVSKADSVVAYFPGFKYKIPPGRRPLNQIWVYFSKESPILSHSNILAKPVWRNWFNWTLTYRRDSDLYSPYGYYVKRSSPVPVGNLTSLVNGKTKMIAWFVSHCPTQSKREDFAAALNKFIPVDIYGQCGNMRCPRDDSEACRQMLARDYHFYLAFENSFCKDYITEKLYSNHDVIPVVRGGANYTALLPKNSFIDASKFPSVKALAQYLKKVVADEELYRSYFAWRSDWRLVGYSETVEDPINLFAFCEHCERLHNLDQWARVYPNMYTWWRNGTCYPPPALVES